jgi:transposase
LNPIQRKVRVKVKTDLEDMRVRAYSDDLRIRVVQAYENAQGSQRQLARRFGVSLSFIQELLKRYHQTGGIEPKPHGGGYPAKIDHQALAALRRLEQQWADATLEEVCEQLEQNSRIKVSPATICRALKKLGLTREKNFSRLGARHGSG